MYIITDNFKYFPCANVIQKLAILCLICVTSYGLPISLYIKHLEVDLLTCDNILQNSK